MTKKLEDNTKIVEQADFEDALYNELEEASEMYKLAEENLVLTQNKIERYNFDRDRFHLMYIQQKDVIVYIKVKKPKIGFK